MDPPPVETVFFLLVRLCYLNQRTSLHVWAAHGGTWGGTIQQQVLRTPPQLLLHLRPRKYLSGGATPESTLQHTHSPQHPPTLSTGCHQCPGSQSTPGPHPLKSSHAAGLSITHRTASGCQRHNHLRDHPKDNPDYSRTPTPYRLTTPPTPMGPSSPTTACNQRHTGDAR